MGSGNHGQFLWHSLHELEAAYDWYFREETLRAAIHHLITYHGTLPLTSLFGDGKTSSSDGIRFGMAASDLGDGTTPRILADVAA